MTATSTSPHNLFLLIITTPTVVACFHKLDENKSIQKTSERDYQATRELPATKERMKQKTILSSPSSETTKTSSTLHYDDWYYNSCFSCCYLPSLLLLSSSSAAFSLLFSNVKRFSLFVQKNTSILRSNSWMDEWIDGCLKKIKKDNFVWDLNSVQLKNLFQNKIILRENLLRLHFTRSLVRSWEDSRGLILIVSLTTSGNEIHPESIT
ncbi:hypothetical protein FF38_01003 [Lucilia cuprina]|uniref:Uncharacterized protein n=1 Tax=Lucilia cuprina TaxID=7375 RepID=A0A0L0BV91_LUCCU|nr:hypothetical protein FF38_01003 [Lucilia cuprina]